MPRKDAIWPVSAGFLAAIAGVLGPCNVGALWRGPLFQMGLRGSLSGCWPLHSRTGDAHRISSTGRPTHKQQQGFGVWHMWGTHTGAPTPAAKTPTPRVAKTKALVSGHGGFPVGQGHTHHWPVGQPHVGQPCAGQPCDGQRRRVVTTHAGEAGNGGGDGTSDNEVVPTHQGQQMLENGVRYDPRDVRNICMVVSYDGTRYAGFQLQARNDTIQLRLETALSNVTKEHRKELKLVTAGRTDAGVHAMAQVCNFLTTRWELPVHLLQKALNAQLPKSIRVLAVQDVPDAFHARYCATGKTYCYHLYPGHDPSPFLYRYRMGVRNTLDMEAVRHVATLFQGTHDFTQFANLSSTERHPIKTIHNITITDGGPALGLQIRVQGTSFLYKQVRHMVGAMLAVGEGRLDVEVIQELLEVGSTRPVGRGARPWTVAEARGLVLGRVVYPDEFGVPECAAAFPLMFDGMGGVWGETGGVMEGGETRVVVGVAS